MSGSLRAHGPPPPRGVDLLALAEAAGWLGPLDVQLARLLDRLGRATPNGDSAEGGGGVAEVALAGALASRQRTRGHSCLHLGSWAGRPIPSPAVPVKLGRKRPGEAEARLPTAEAWRRALERSPLVAVEPTDATPPSPLVLDAAGRLYLWRYHRAERRLARRLRDLVSPSPATATLGPEDSPGGEDLSALFRRLFPEARPVAPHRGAPRTGSGGDTELDGQAVAAAAALAGRLTVISGGPGTGKTTTVTRILVLLAASDPEPRFALAAPTGKAAARLEESIAAQAADLPVHDSLRSRIPRSAATLHRLLGFSPRTDRFRHRAGEPLRADVVVVDEASMVDLLMMDRLLDALPASARLILLGDRDQLASVETGFVFGDLCAAAGLGHAAEPSLAPRLGAVYGRLVGTDGRGEEAGRDPRSHPAPTLPDPTFADAAVELRRSYRFRDQPGIGALATAIREQDPPRALAVLEDPSFDDVARRDPPDRAPDLLAGVLERIEACPCAPGPGEALEALARFRILAATRTGPWGVERLNRLVEQQLAARGREVASAEDAGTAFYPGRPVLVRANDYQLCLFNGDLGVVWPDAGRLWAFFPELGEAGKGGPGLRRLPLAKLPDHDTAWAMTVHQSQGSELDSLLLVLPTADSTSDLVSRELLYTGVTRARRRVELVATRTALTAAIEHTAQRISGLADALARTLSPGG